MPVLYDIAIFLQDEFIEQFLEQEGMPPNCEDKVAKIEFSESPLAQLYTTLCQHSYRR